MATNPKDILATTNKGTIVKGPYWNKIEELPPTVKATVKEEIRNAISNGQTDTALRPIMPGEVRPEHNECYASVAFNVKKMGDIQQCFKPAKYIQYHITRPSHKADMPFWGAEVYCPECVQAGRHKRED